MKLNIHVKALDIARSFFKNFNLIILACTFILIVAGIFTNYSATYTLQKSLFYKQLIWYAVGLVLMMLFANVNYNIWIGVANHLYYFMLFLLLVVMIAGHTAMGAQRWINLGGFHMQPSEFMKIVVPLALIRFILVSQRDPFTWKNIFKLFGILLVPVIMVLKQPDLGTAILLIPVALVILFIGDIPVKKLAVIIIAGVLILPASYMLLRDYQKERLQVFINPDADKLGSGYNVIQSKIAIGSGRLFGKGWMRGTQSQLNFIPIKYTDFVFAVISEEFGFAGSIFVLLIYLVLIMEGLKVVKLCQQSAGKMLGGALTMTIFAQFSINIGMNLGLMPVTGITLPLLSYGGSSIAVMMTALGMLQNIYREYMKAEG